MTFEVPPPNAGGAGRRSARPWLSGTLLGALLLTGAAAAQEASPEDLARRAIERRAVEAVIWGMPAVNTDLMLQAMLEETEGEVNQVIYWGRPLDWMNQTLTPNPDTIYFMTFLDTREGPMVIDIPPAEGGSLNGNIVNVWQMPLEDVGARGVDQGAGGRFAILPPGYDEPLPEGFTGLQSDTFGTYALLRSNLESHDDEDVAAAVAYGQQVQVYPLAEAEDPPETVFTDVQDVVFDSTIPYDASFFEHLDRVVQSEPWLDRDRVMIDQLATIGIVKGQPFAPDPATTELLDQAAQEAGAWLEARYDAGLPPYFEGGHWTFPAPTDLIQEGQAGFTNPDAYPVDSRGMAYSYAYIGIKRLGAGQFYLISIRDADGEAYDGSQTYRLTVPADPPVEQYWSVTAYDRETHALIRDMPHASRSSQAADLQANEDGSVDIYFGPEAPEGLESNWVPTDPERRFELMMRFYGPTEALTDRTWVLPDVEKVE